MTATPAAVRRGRAAAAHDGATLRRNLAALRDALAAARERTELDGFDEAMFEAVQGLIAASESNTAAVEGLVRAARRTARRSR